MTSNFDNIRGYLADIEKQLGGLNDAPNTAVQSVENQTAGDEPSKRHLSIADQYAIRGELRKRSFQELSAMFGMQLRRRDTGVPFEAWTQAGGSSALSAFNSAELPMEIRKAIDSSGASALIRQDLEPVLYELFVKTWPAYDRFTKEPANGLVHAFNQITDFGDAQFMTELGTVTDDQSVYNRETTNVAILGTRRGVSLKSQFAVQAGGMAYNPEQLELQGGLRAMAHKMQKTIFQGNATASGGSGSGEDGAYDANGFTGLRYILNDTQSGVNDSVNVDPATNPTTTGNLRRAFDAAAVTISDNGGSASVIYATNTTKRYFDEQQDDNVRYMDNLVNIVPGVLTNAVNTVFGPLPIVPVPGDSIGTYTATTYSSNTVSDAYMLDEGTITLPYLGSEGPTVLDIPIGISGQLTHLYVIFLMSGLAVKALPFSGKIRVKQA